MLRRLNVYFSTVRVYTLSRAYERVDLYSLVSCYVKTKMSRTIQPFFLIYQGMLHRRTIFLNCTNHLNTIS